MQYSFIHPEMQYSPGELDALEQAMSRLLTQLTGRPQTARRGHLEYVIGHNSRVLLASEPFDDQPEEPNARWYQCGTIVGMATLVPYYTPLAYKGLIEDVVVLETHRRRGIGRALLERLIEEALKQKMVHVELTSHPSRVVANAMYATLGFERRDTNVYRMNLLG